uniref:Uncharacterized protein n=1 Tax=Plectus sambesii TaxID=2011161 RepID=A0A914W2Q6_9BILA
MGSGGRARRWPAAGRRTRAISRPEIRDNRMMIGTDFVGDYETGPNRSSSAPGPSTEELRIVELVRWKMVPDTTGPADNRPHRSHLAAFGQSWPCLAPPTNRSSRPPFPPPPPPHTDRICFNGRHDERNFTVRDRSGRSPNSMYPTNGAWSSSPDQDDMSFSRPSNGHLFRQTSPQAQQSARQHFYQNRDSVSYGSMNEQQFGSNGSQLPVDAWGSQRQTVFDSITHRAMSPTTPASVNRHKSPEDFVQPFANAEREYNLIQELLKLKIGGQGASIFEPAIKPHESSKPSGNVPQQPWSNGSNAAPAASHTSAANNNLNGMRPIVAHRPEPIPSNTTKTTPIREQQPLGIHVPAQHTLANGASHMLRSPTGPSSHLCPPQTQPSPHHQMNGSSAAHLQQQLPRPTSPRLQQQPQMSEEALQVITLLAKMEQLRNEPLSRSVHGAMRELVDAVKLLQQCRLQERANIFQQLRGDISRLQEDKDTLSLASALQALNKAVRRARSATWCSLMQTLQNPPTLEVQAQIDGLVTVDYDAEPPEIKHTLGSAMPTINGSSTAEPKPN